MNVHIMEFQFIAMQVIIIIEFSSIKPLCDLLFAVTLTLISQLHNNKRKFHDLRLSFQEDIPEDKFCRSKIFVEMCNKVVYDKVKIAG